MPKLKIEDLAIIKERISIANSLREDQNSTKIIVHLGTCGIANGARKILHVIMEELEKSKRKDIVITTSGCIGLCKDEPLITIKKTNEKNIQYSNVDDSKMRTIFTRHILEGKVQSQWLLTNDENKD